MSDITVDLEINLPGKMDIKTIFFLDIKMFLNESWQKSERDSLKVKFSLFNFDYFKRNVE